jgi:hypothetical protein
MLSHTKNFVPANTIDRNDQDPLDINDATISTLSKLSSTEPSALSGNSLPRPSSTLLQHGRHGDHQTDTPGGQPQIHQEHKSRPYEFLVSGFCDKGLRTLEVCQEPITQLERSGRKLGTPRNSMVYTSPKVDCCKNVHTLHAFLAMRSLHSCGTLVIVAFNIFIAPECLLLFLPTK